MKTQSLEEMKEWHESVKEVFDALPSKKKIETDYPCPSGRRARNKP